MHRARATTLKQGKHDDGLIGPRIHPHKADRQSWAPRRGYAIRHHVREGKTDAFHDLFTHLVAEDAGRGEPRI